MDLKSPNILVGESGIAKLADVGLARVMGSESFVSQVVSFAFHLPIVYCHKTLFINSSDDQTFAHQLHLFVWI